LGAQKSSNASGDPEAGLIRTRTAISTALPLITALSGWRFEDPIVVINGWRVHIVYIRTRERYLVFRRSVARGLSPGHLSDRLLYFSGKSMEDIFGGNGVLSDSCLIGQPGGTHSQRHDYLNYLEAWMLGGAR